MAKHSVGTDSLSRALMYLEEQLANYLNESAMLSDSTYPDESGDSGDAGTSIPPPIYSPRLLYVAVCQLENCYSPPGLPKAADRIWGKLLRITRGRIEGDAMEVVDRFHTWLGNELRRIEDSELVYRSAKWFSDNSSIELSALRRAKLDGRVTYKNSGKAIRYCLNDAWNLWQHLFHGVTSWQTLIHLP